MPQTEEHSEQVADLEVRRGVFVLRRIDEPEEER